MNQHITAHLNMGVAGRYIFHKGSVDENGVPIPGTHRKVAEFDNLITNTGLDKIATCPGGSFGVLHLYPYCYVGTGNTAPAVTDGTLSAWLATSPLNEGATVTFVDEAGAVPAYWKTVKTWRFNPGVATGNIAEVGAGWATNNLFSRALVVDGGGSPATITVLASEYLDVTYEVRNYIDKTLYTTAITISGVNYSVDYRPTAISTPPNCNIALMSGSGGLYRAVAFSTDVLGTVYNNPAGSGTPITGSFNSYIAGTYYVDIGFTFGLSDANFAGGIGSLVLEMNNMKYQMKFTPKIPKDGTKILTINLRVNWSRYP